MPKPTASVVVCTYNAEKQLELVLAGLARQTEPPLEILIADDGSKKTTGTMIENWKKMMPGPLHHVWHDDRGKQKAVIVNKTVSVSEGSQLLFLDGDCIPHPKWVSDHIQAAKSDPEAVWCGRRFRLGPEISEKITPQDIQTGQLDSAFSSFIRAPGNHRWGNALRLPWWLARVINRKTKGLMGCNFSLSRAAFESVNGYEEDWPGMSQLLEDWDLEVRLRKEGRSLRSIINTAVVYHLYHHERERSEEVLLLREERKKADIRAKVGLNQYNP